MGHRSRKRRTRRLRAFALGAALWLAPGCVGLGLGDLLGPPSCVGAWRSAERIPPHRGQRLRFATGSIDSADGEAQLRGELVTSALDGELTVIGLTPFGTRAFTATQVGERLRLDAGIARRLGLEPYHLLDALHRGLWSEAAADMGAVRGRGDEPIEVVSTACGYRTRLLVLPPGNAASAGN